MHSGTKAGRIAGLLLLLVFAIGVLNFQVLQSSVLSGAEDFEGVAASARQIVASAIAGLSIGSISIVVAVILLPVFRRSSEGLAYAYVAFSVVSFVAISIDTVSVLSVLEMSRLYASDAIISERAADGLVPLLYGRHWWTHHLYLLTSCLPVFILYYTLYVSRGVPRVLSLFGVFAAVTMAVGVIGAMAGNGLGEMTLLPIAIVQVSTPLWLMARGLSVDE